MTVFSVRCEKAQSRMRDKAMDWLMVPVSSDLVYLSGHTARPTERLTLLTLPGTGRPTIVFPAFERRKIEQATGREYFDFATWDESTDPTAVVGAIVGDSPCVIAVGDQLWSAFLLSLQEQLPRAQFVSATPIMVPLRLRKDQSEIECLLEVGRRMDLVYADVCSLKFAGRTELELAEDVFRLVRRHGLNPSRLGGVSGGPNSSFPHHRSEDRVMNEGDAVWIELGQGGSFGGYAADMTRVFHVGEPSAEFTKVYEVVRRANEETFSMLTPGIPCQDVDRHARHIITEAGYGDYFTHRVGHGLGLDGHEPPYMVEGNALPLEEGMVFSVEPGIYLPGRFGIRIEDIVVMRSDGPENIYSAAHDLAVVS